MPIVSPGGIVTPADSDGWDLTTDLATMATSIDSAVSAANAGANAFKGTASDRGLFTSTAVNGMLWQDTDGMKMIWRKDGAQWVPAVWRWSGTATQMNAFTQAPNGFEWYNSTSGHSFTRGGSGWVRSQGVIASGSNIGSTTLTTTGGFTVVAAPGGVTVPVTVPVSTDVKITLIANFSGNASAVCQCAVSLSGGTTFTPVLDAPGLGKVLASNQNAVSTQLLTLNAGTTQVIARARSAATVVFGNPLIIVERA